MNDKDQELFNELIRAAGTLATVADQAAVVLSEDFENMVRPQIDQVRAILSKCPVQGKQTFFNDDGSLRESDLDIETFSVSGDRPGETSHVKIVHRPTGEGRESYSKPTQAENHRVALKSLTKKIQEKYS